MSQNQVNLPSQIADALVSIPKGLTPGVIKALDRLVGATVDIPVAWLHQKKAQIDAQTESFKLVEASIAETVASRAGDDPDIAQRAMTKLVRKEYRKQVNLEAVATAMVEDIRDQAFNTENVATVTAPTAELDDDWLNIFEQYSESASSERMQGLWGRVLSGEIRQPGRFSMRTLRFLSEFSQADALMFERFTKFAFGDSAPKDLVAPKERDDIRDLIFLVANGIIQGATGLGLEKTYEFNENGRAYVREGNLLIILYGEPKKQISHKVVILTPLGQELLCLVGSRDPRAAARTFASSIKRPDIYEASLAALPEQGDGQAQLMEVLWLKEEPSSQVSESGHR